MNSAIKTISNPNNVGVGNEKPDMNTTMNSANITKQISQNNLDGIMSVKDKLKMPEIPSMDNGVANVKNEFKKYFLNKVGDALGIDHNMQSPNPKQVENVIEVVLNSPEIKDDIKNAVTDMTTQVVEIAAQTAEKAIPSAVQTGTKLVGAIPGPGNIVSFLGALQSSADTMKTMANAAKETTILAQETAYKIASVGDTINNKIEDAKNVSKNAEQYIAKSGQDAVKNAANTAISSINTVLGNTESVNIPPSSTEENNNVGGSSKKRKLNATLKLKKLKQEQHGGIKRIKKSLKQFQSGITTAKSMKMFSGQRNKTRRK